MNKELFKKAGRLVIFTGDQGTKEWHRVRSGKLTGSTVSFETTKSGDLTAASKKLHIVKASERIAGRTNEIYFKQAEHGHTYEVNGRSEYEARTGNIVKEMGFAILNDFEGDSPDGIVDFNWSTGCARGVLEIKSHVAPEVFGEIVDGGRPLKKHMRQLLHHFHVFNADFVDYVSYIDGEVGGVEMFICRLLREDYATAIEEHAGLCSAMAIDIKATEDRLRVKLEANRLLF